MRATERIIKYLEGKMSPLEAAAFEEELKNNPRLISGFVIHSKIDEFIGDEEALQFRELITKVKKGYSCNNLITRVVDSLAPKGKIRLLYAASVVFAFVMLTYYLFLPGKLTPPELYQAYFIPYEADFTARSAIRTDTFLMAMAEYDKGNYNAAISLFNFLSENHPSRELINFFSGISYMELDSTDKAVRVFSDIIHNDPGGPYMLHAKWYKALCYIKNEYLEQARLILEEIYDSDSYYSEQASNILKSL